MSRWRFSALTLGFFDVAICGRRPASYAHRFQCPNAGLLRCGLELRVGMTRSRSFSALTLGFFDVANQLPGGVGHADVVSVP